MYLLKARDILLIIICLIVIGSFFSAQDDTVELKNVKVFRKAIYSIPEKLIIPEMVSTAEHTISHLTLEGLFTVDNLDIVPQLVKRTSLDETQTVYEFEIKENIFFSDGTKLTLNDVKASLERTFKKDSPIRDTFKRIKSVNIRNNKVIVEIKSPYPPFLSLLASSFAKVYKEKEGIPYPIGTSAWKYEKIEMLDKHKVLILSRNNFSNKKVYINRIELWELSEDEALSLMGKGVIHDTSIYLSKSKLFGDNKRVSQNFAQAAVTWLFPFNLKNKKLANIDLRKCLHKNFNKIDFIHRFRPDHKEALGFLPKTLLGGGKEIVKNDLKDLDCSQFNGIKLVFDIPKELGGQVEGICKYVKSSYSKIGIKIKCNPIQFGLLIERIKRGVSEISFMAQTMDFFDVEYFFNTFESNSNFNISNFISTKVDLLLRKARTTADRFERLKYYHELNQFLFDNYVTLNISYPDHISYRHSCLENLEIGIVGETYINFNNIGLNPNCEFLNDFKN